MTCLWNAAVTIIAFAEIRLVCTTSTATRSIFQDGRHQNRKCAWLCHNLANLAPAIRLSSSMCVITIQAAINSAMMSVCLPPTVRPQHRKYERLVFQHDIELPSRSNIVKAKLKKDLKRRLTTTSTSTWRIIYDCSHCSARHRRRRVAEGRRALIRLSLVTASDNNKK